MVEDVEKEKPLEQKEKVKIEDINIILLPPEEGESLQEKSEKSQVEKEEKENDYDQKKSIYEKYIKNSIPHTITDPRYGVRVDDHGVIVSEIIFDEGKDWRNFDGETKGSPRGYSITPINHYRAGAEFADPGRHVYFRGIRINTNKLNRQIRSGRVRAEDRRIVSTFSCLKRLMSVMELTRDRTVMLTAKKIIHEYYRLKNAANQSVTEKESKVLAFVALEKAAFIHSRAISLNKLREAFASISGIDVSEQSPSSRLVWQISTFLSERNVFRRLGYGSMLKRVNSHIEFIVSSLVEKNKIISNPREVINFAKKIVNINVNQFHKSLAGKKTEAIAAAAVYFAGRLYNNDITQKDVAEVVSLKESNVRKAFRFLLSDIQYVAILKPYEG